MSVVLVGDHGTIAAATIARLRAQDDEVRVIEPDRAAGMRWRDLGAVVADGHADDADLVERAAYGARTVVLVDGFDIAGPVIEGTRMANVSRIVLVTSDPAGQAASQIKASGLPYVIVALPKTGLLRRAKPLSPEQIAEAIDAADDLAGDPELVADLGTAEGWDVLGLAAE